MNEVKKTEAPTRRAFPRVAFAFAAAGAAVSALPAAAHPHGGAIGADHGSLNHQLLHHLGSEPIAIALELSPFAQLLGAAFSAAVLAFCALRAPRRTAAVVAAVALCAAIFG